VTTYQLLFAGREATTGLPVLVLVEVAAGDEVLVTVTTVTEAVAEAVAAFGSIPAPTCLQNPVNHVCKRSLSDSRVHSAAQTESGVEYRACRMLLWQKQFS
jgi:hypothetical protein